MKSLKHVKFFFFLGKDSFESQSFFNEQKLSNSDFNQRRWCKRVSRANGEQNSETEEYLPLAFPEAFSKAISNPLSGPAGSSAFTKQKHTSKGACRVYWFKSSFILSECAHFVCWYNKNSSNYYCWVWYVCILNCESLLHPTDGETNSWEHGPEMLGTCIWSSVTMKRCGLPLRNTPHNTEREEAQVHITSPTAAFPNFLQNPTPYSSFKISMLFQIHICLCSSLFFSASCFYLAITYMKSLAGFPKFHFLSYQNHQWV